MTAGQGLQPGETTPAAVQFVSVAVPVPVQQSFQYRVPAAFEGRVEVGVRVRVPFGRRDLVGTVVRIDREAVVERPLDLRDVYDQDVRVSPALLGLLEWLAERFGASLGEALEAAVPAAVRHRGRSRRTVLLCLKDEWQVPERARQEVDALDARYPKQARALRLLADAGGQMRELDLRRVANVSQAPIRSLERRGILRRELREDPSLLGEEPVERTAPPTLSPAQAEAVKAIRAGVRSRKARSFLLFGVTGSGKTEVYLQALAETVARGRRGIVLVPEISLTPQTVARFRARFERIAVLHSALTDAERRRQFARIERGEVDVVVGARSAVFAPMPELGLVVVDEEHEPSFKQQNPPRYHAREVALERGLREKAVVVLGSATPSLESWHAARSGHHQLLTLPERVGGGQLPRTVCLDLQNLPFQRTPHLLTQRLREALRITVDRREQAILFLNRRGFARLAVCASCKQAIQCPDCDVSLVLHQAARRLVCHLCGHERNPPAECPGCHLPRLRFLGFGTERVEDEVARAVPGARIVRMDSDTTAVRGSHERILQAFGEGKIDVLVGTQMIAKGLDFPRVTLVGIVSADTSLMVPDYRANERTFQLVAQVAGRAGRSRLPGLVLVQTLQPQHPAIRAAVRHDYLSFVEGELALREEAGYPPFRELVRVLVSHPDEERTRRSAQRAIELLQPVASEHDVALLGPAPCPITRVRGRCRYQILLKCARRASMRQVVTYAHGKVTSSHPVRITLDVDPVSLL